MKKVAIVHDNLLEYGGSEKVLEALITAYPDADFYTFFFNKKNSQLMSKFGHLRWQTSIVQHIPFIANLNQYFSLLKPLAWRYFSHLDLSRYDLVLTSSHSYNSKSVKTAKKATHFSYVHTPPRFLYGYSHELTHLTTIPFLQWIFELMKKEDFKAAQNPDYLLVSGVETQQRVRRYYCRDSIVLPPPVQQNFKQAPQQKRTYYLAHSRLVRQKGINLLVRTCVKYNLQLKVIGDGYLRKELEKITSKNIEFLGFVEEKNLPKVYGGAKALLYAAREEDFGIVPIEAQSYGVPVIAYREGALQQTVIEGRTGYFFDTLTTQAVYKAIQKLESQPLRAKNCIEQARKFRPEIFIDKLRTIVHKHTKK